MRALRPVARRGMTIIEVLFAIVILSGVMLALSRFGQGFQRATRNAANLAIASDLATSRVEVVRTHLVYSTLKATFEGTEVGGGPVANPPMAAYPGFTRSTAVTRTQGSGGDYTTVTVTVTADVLRAPMVKTAVIAAF